MSRYVSMAIFLSVMTLIVSAVHYYIWARLVRDLGLSLPWRRGLTVLIVLLAISLPLSFLLMRSSAQSMVRFVSAPVYIWMGTFFLLFVGLLARDGLRVLGWVGQKTIFRGTMIASSGTADLDRRLLITRLGAGMVVLGASGAAGAAVRTGFSRPKVKRLEVRLARLPAAADGFRLVQLTDLHIGPLLGRGWLDGVVQQTNALKPDLIAITGDLVDGSVQTLRDAVAPLRALRAPHGVFFVTGNHEYYSGVAQWLPELVQLGIHVLRNERVTIHARSGEALFDLAGVDDAHGGRIEPGHGTDVDKALKGRPADREVILLAHQPIAIFEAARHNVSLQLSGHTHGGQIWPMRYLVRLQQPYIAGYVQHGPTQLYVSEGTGFWGPPMRLGTRSEITEVILRAGSTQRA